MNGYVFWGAAAMGQLAGLLGLVSEAMVPASRRMGGELPNNVSGIATDLQRDRVAIETTSDHGR